MAVMISALPATSLVGIRLHVRVFAFQSILILREMNLLTKMEVTAAALSYSSAFVGYCRDVGKVFSLRLID